MTRSVRRRRGRPQRGRLDRHCDARRSVAMCEAGSTTSSRHIAWCGPFAMRRGCPMRRALACAALIAVLILPASVGAQEAAAGDVDTAIRGDRHLRPLPIRRVPRPPRTEVARTPAHGHGRWFGGDLDGTSRWGQVAGIRSTPTIVVSRNGGDVREVNRNSFRFIARTLEQMEADCWGGVG